MRLEHLLQTSLHDVSQLSLYLHNNLNDLLLYKRGGLMKRLR